MMGEVADVPADLGGQVGLDVFGSPFPQQRVGMVLVGDGEFEVIDDVADSRRLLRRPIDEHGLVGRRHLARERDDAVARDAP